jgi:glutathione reductase (NADPH)
MKVYHSTKNCTEMHFVRNEEIMNTETFDVLVVGTGASAKSVAYPCAAKGLRVAVVDNRPFGGTCELRGCDPKKVLVGVTEALALAAQLQGKGVQFSDLHIDWSALMQFKQTFVQGVPESVEKGFKDAGMQTFHGTARFVDNTSVVINEDIKITAKHIAIASGATPVKLGIPGEDYLAISDDFLDLATLPKRIIFIGGGYISFEFAHIARRAGAEVTILHRSNEPLKEFDQDLVAKLIDATRKLGIKVQVNTPVAGIEKTATGFTVHTTANDGSKKLYEADLVVHGAGRVPNLAALDLTTGNVASGKKGVTVNAYLQSTTNPSVYAVGDASAYGLPLTPVAGKEGDIVARNILNGNTAKADFKATPSVVYTIPPLATVGLTEQQAKEQDLDITVKFADSTSWYSSRRINEEVSAYKTIVDKQTNAIVGAHLLGHNAEEVINIFALAIAYRLPPAEVQSALYSYPTKSSDISYLL